MTDRDSVVEALRAGVLSEYEREGIDPETGESIPMLVPLVVFEGAAAHNIIAAIPLAETLERENAELREALEKILVLTTDVEHALWLACAALDRGAE